MQYDVQFSELAEKQYDNILKYIVNVLKNPQALKNVMDDFDATVKRLECAANSFGFCKCDRLKVMGLRIIGFEKHRFLFVYPLNRQASYHRRGTGLSPSPSRPCQIHRSYRSG